MDSAWNYTVGVVEGYVDDINVNKQLTLYFIVCPTPVYQKTIQVYAKMMKLMELLQCNVHTG